MVKKKLLKQDSHCIAMYYIRPYNMYFDEICIRASI